MDAAFKNGMRHVDHFWCAMSTVPSIRKRLGVPMQGSMLEYVLGNPEMSTEVIADGMHLSPELLRFAWQLKTAQPTLFGDRLQPRLGHATRQIPLWTSTGWIMVHQRRQRLAGQALTHSPVPSAEWITWFRTCTSQQASHFEEVDPHGNSHTC